MTDGPDQRWPPHGGPDKERTMIPFIKKYAVEIVAAIGYITSIATALGLSREHYVAIALGVLSTIAVVLTKFFTITKPARQTTRLS